MMTSKRKFTLMALFLEVGQTVLVKGKQQDYESRITGKSIQSGKGQKVIVVIYLETTPLFESYYKVLDGESCVTLINTPTN